MGLPVSIRNVSVSFGRYRALDSVSLEIAAGEIFFLLGPSGCGKTTLLRTIAGFCRPESGEIFIGEEDVTNLPAHKRDTGMMFQSYALWPHMTLKQNVSFGLEMRRLPRREISERAVEALKMVHLDHRADDKPNALSGGQQQRIALARALVINPRCLLLDEPLSNLDANLRREMRHEIRQACKSHGLTAIYVTHDLEEAAAVADRMAIMKDGRIMQVGTCREIKTNPADGFVAEFVGR